MKKSLVMFLVATLLLAGCTELADSEDGETKNIEVNEDIALEKIDDFMTVDESESFGITMMYDMDPAMMGMEEGMLEVGEDSEAVITIEMTEAWSPDGYHTSSSRGMVNGGSSMKFVTSMTHIGTTMYIEMGYETQGDLCADEETQEDIEMCEMMFGDMPAVQSYSMTTTTTHTDVIAAMAEETADDADMDPRFMLEIISYTECMGSFTPAGTVDGLQMFNVSMDMMGEESSLTPQLALCMFDSDDSNTISLDEFLAADESDADDEEADELKTIFDESDLDTNGELNKDELATFIEAIDTNEEEHDHDDHSDHSVDHDDYDEMDGGEDPEMMPDMSVAFNNAGEIEYFSMNMEGTEMKMYVLTEDRVDSLLTNVETGTLVALPFSISDSMYDDEWEDDSDDGWDDNSEDSDEINSLDDFDVSYWDSTNDLQQIVDWFNNNYEYGEDESMMTVEDFLDSCDADSDSINNDVAECIFNEAMEMLEMHDDADNDAPTASDLLSMTDTDENSAMTPEEFFTFLESDEGCCLPQEMKDDINGLMNQSDADSSGDLDVNELEGFILDFVNYQDSMEEDGDEGDDHDGHDHGDDDGHDHGDDDGNDHGSEDDEPCYFNDENQLVCGERVWYITNEMDFHFEGNMSTYYIEFASCEEETDYETGETTKDCSPYSQILVADAAAAGGSNGVMYHDADNSGTISEGDMIHVTDEMKMQYDVRLYLMSADAYSDENPMHNAPGFTGLVGMLALLGAAFIRRND